MENKTWPDEIRLEMIEKSQGYSEPTVYQYGYYDGYQKAASQFTPQSAPVSETTGRVEGKHRQGEVYPNDTDFDKMSKHYNNNVFMRNADIWTDQFDWVMSKDRFISVIEKLFTLPVHKVDAYVSLEDIKKQIFRHLDSLPYAGGYPSDWQDTLSKHIYEWLSLQPVAADIKDNVIELLKEDLECVHKYLDEKLTPRKDSYEKDYSIVGRIKFLEKYCYNPMIIKSDNICPKTFKPCDDECCPVGAVCNISSDDTQDILQPVSTPAPQEVLTEGKLLLHIQDKIYEFLNYHRIEEPVFDVREVKMLAEDIIRIITPSVKQEDAVSQPPEPDKVQEQFYWDGVDAQMKQKPNFAIGIPTLNRFDLLFPALIYYQQDFPDTKIHIFDNGCQPGLKFVWASQDGKAFSYYSPNKNKGVAASWNYLIKQIFSDQDIKYAVIMNDDIYWGQDQETIKILMLNIELGHQISQKACDQDKGFIVIPKELKYQWSIFAISREAWETIGKFDSKFFPAYFEDKDYEYRAKLAGVTIYEKLPSPARFVNSGTLKKDPSILPYSAKNRDYYVKKWGGEPGAEKFTVPFNGEK